MSLSWRELRNSTARQNLFLDALTVQGQFAKAMKPHGGTYTPRVLYGGAGFGGKSYAERTATMELNGVLRELGFPGRWGALVCRRYSPDLADIHLKKLAAEFADYGMIRNTKVKGLFFEFFDRSLGGFYLRNADDPKKRRGIEYDWIIVDELTQFTREEYDHIMYNLRSEARLPFKAFGAGTNPDGPGHGWVKRWWIDRDFSDIQMLIDAGAVSPDDFVFVPARAADNPSFDITIQATLMGFDDPMLVAARWDGSWNLASGTRFARFNPYIHCYDTEDFEDAFGMPEFQVYLETDLCYVFGSLDFGTDVNSATAFYLHMVDSKRRVWTFHEEYLQGLTLDEQADIIRPLLEKYKVQRTWCDPALTASDSDGISRLDKFRLRGVPMVPGINNRVEGWSTLDTFLAYKLHENGRDYLQAPAWRIHNRCRHLKRFLSDAPRDDINPEDVSRKFKADHAGDSVRYFLHSYFGTPRSVKQQNGVQNWVSSYLSQRAAQMHGSRQQSSFKV